MKKNPGISQPTIQGEGQPLVWLHGMLNSVESDSIYSLIDLCQLSKLVSLVRFDACNKSDIGNYTWDAMADELISMADSQKYYTMILGGSSMGAGTAIHCAVKFPDRVKALILVTPPPAWEMRSGVKAIYEKIAAKARQDAIPEILKRVIQRNQDPPDFFEQIHPGTRQLLLDHRLGFKPQYYSSIYLGGAVSDLPTREQISNINVPTVIVSLIDDENHPIKMAHELNNLIKDSELIIVRDYDSYQKLQMKIRDFIKLLE